MRRSSCIALTAMFLLGVSSLTERAEAGGVIDMECWKGIPPTFGPPITLGCTLDWHPGPPLQSGNNVWWKIEFTCLTGCTVNGSPATFTYSLLSPASNIIHKFIGANCTPYRHTLTVKSRASSVRKVRGVDDIVQLIDRSEFGNVDPTQYPPFCPFISGGVGVGAP